MLHIMYKLIFKEKWTMRKQKPLHFFAKCDIIFSIEIGR